MPSELCGFFFFFLKRAIWIHSGRLQNYSFWSTTDYEKINKIIDYRQAPFSTLKRLENRAPFQIHSAVSNGVRSHFTTLRAPRWNSRYRRSSPWSCQQTRTISQLRNQTWDRVLFSIWFLLQNAAFESWLNSWQPVPSPIQYIDCWLLVVSFNVLTAVALNRHRDDRQLSDPFVRSDSLVTQHKDPELTWNWGPKLSKELKDGQAATDSNPDQKRALRLLEKGANQRIRKQSDEL